LSLDLAKMANVSTGPAPRFIHGISMNMQIQRCLKIHMTVALVFHLANKLHLDEHIVDTLSAIMAHQ
jgi:hypothetical protein